MAPTQTAARMESGAPVESLFSDAVRHHQQGHHSEAEKLYRQISKLQPLHAEAWSNLSLLLMGRGDHKEATEACRRAISIRPTYLEAHLNLIASLDAMQAFEEEADIYRKAIPLAPGRADLWNFFGQTLIKIDRTAQAVLAYQEAIKIKPDFAEAYFNLGRALSNLGFVEEAIGAYRQAITHDSKHAAAYSNLGTLLGATSRFAEAAVASECAAALAPTSAEIHCNHGVVLQRAGRVNEAVAAYQKALAVRPNYAAALANLAAGLQELYKFDEAMDALKQAIAINPDFINAITDLIKIRRHVCDWSLYEEDRQTLLRFIAEKKDAIFMLLLMCFQTTPKQQLDCARIAMAKLNAVTPPRNARIAEAGRKIRIGYLSNDYRDHPVGRLVPDLFALHDRERFEVICYSLGKEDPGALRQRIKQNCDLFIDLHTMSDAEAAQRITADGTDILIDLTGPTVGSRLEMLAKRPAPIQVSFLGWPGSMGADFIDYVVGDPFVIPAEQQPFYCEKIVHLPDVYQPSDVRRPVPERKASRADYGLPDDGFVFCSFNNPNKITPEMFELWMRLLRKVEKSVLWLYCKSAQTVERLKARAAALGVEAERIIFASVATYDVYLDRLCQADLFLDSTPYNAGATCNDALWVGLPVLTCTGETYVSRMAGSLLNAAGMPELVTHSLEDYEKQALALANEPGLLTSLRERLNAGRTTSLLFDMPRFTKNLERALTEMHGIRLAGQEPRFISVAHSS